MSGEINVGDTVRILGSDAVGTVSKILNDRNNRLVVSLGKYFCFVHSEKNFSVVLRLVIVRSGLS